MKYTLNDPKGNMILSVEKCDPTRSTEADGELVFLASAFALIMGAWGACSIKEHIDKKKFEKETAKLNEKKDAILNSQEYKDAISKTNMAASYIAKLHANFVTHFKKEIENLSKTNETIAKYKMEILKGLEKPSSEQSIKKEIAESIMARYFGTDEWSKEHATASVPIYYYTDIVSDSGDWDYIWPEVDSVIDSFNIPEDKISKSIELCIEDSGWDCRIFEFDLIGLLKQ